MIAFDFAAEPVPYRSQRYLTQMAHMAAICERLDKPVKVIVNPQVIEATAVFNNLHTIKHLWSTDRSDIDIHFASARAWGDETARKLMGDSGYKVAINSSDRKHKKEAVNSVDCMLTVNYNAWMHESGKMVVGAHFPSDKIINEFRRRYLYNDYLDDNLDTIRDVFFEPVCGWAGFMGNPHMRRGEQAKLMPWASFDWSRSKSATEYISFLMKYVGCIDMKGMGDKNLRFAEAVLFGRIIITVPVFSLYDPPLVDGENCVMRQSWEEFANVDSFLKTEELWSSILERATACYKSGWSLRGQLLNVLSKAGEAHERPVSKTQQII